MATKSNPPNRGGSGPKITKQGKSGPIIGKMTSLSGSTKPWDPSMGKSKPSFVKGAKNSGNKRG